MQEVYAQTRVATANHMVSKNNPSEYQCLQAFITRKLV